MAVSLRAIRQLDQREVLAILLTCSVPVTIFVNVLAFYCQDCALMTNATRTASQLRMKNSCNLLFSTREILFLVHKGYWFDGLNMLKKFFLNPLMNFRGESTVVSRHLGTRKRCETLEYTTFVTPEQMQRMQSSSSLLSAPHAVAGPESISGFD